MQRLGNALFASVLLFTIGTTACHKEEGPAERAGKEIDKATDDTSDAMKDAGKKLGEKMEDAGEKMQGK